MGNKAKLIVDYAQNLAACAALAVGGSLVFHFADKLILGPWPPRLIGGLLFLAAFVLAATWNTELAVALTEGTKHKWVRMAFTAGIAVLLQWVCIYFVAAATIAALTSASPS